MRVISGMARGKKLISSQGLETRPTLDRVKEALFNKIQFNIKDADILDLFSGSGALAIEALSRGASSAVLCDNSNKAIKIIIKNLEDTRVADRAKVINKDYLQTLNKLRKESKKFDIIFLDPPYKSDYIVKSLENILKYDLLTEDGIIIAETDDKNKIEEIKNIKNIKIYDTRKYGIAYVIFIRKG